MLIEGYDLEILTPPCEPGAERYFAKAHLPEDISEVLPYLNGTLSGASFMPAAKALTWEKDGHRVAFHAVEIDLGTIESREWAEQQMDELIELINRTWDRREELTPDFETIQRLTPMAVYQRLPKTNCGQCGESTCFNFGLKLVMSQKELKDCPPLFEPQYGENLSALEADLIAAGHAGG
ncbi:hypothetical protein HQ535_00275 [bacterium]|nr:hypothetical protein [bacterium]